MGTICGHNNLTFHKGDNKLDKLNARFSAETKAKINKLATSEDMQFSMIARAAMNIGLDKLAAGRSEITGDFKEWVKANQ